MTSMTHMFPSSLVPISPDPEDRARRSPNELSTIHSQDQQDGGDPARLAMTAKLRDLARLLETSRLEATMDEAQAEDFTLLTIKLKTLPDPEPDSGGPVGSGMPNLGFKNIPTSVNTE